MPKQSKVGDTNVSANGYHYTKTEDGWRLTHHLIAEKELGRKIHKDERVSFKDNDRTNLDPDNIQVRRKKQTKEDKIRALKEKIAVLEQELAELQSS